jgi:hypothetical protein
MQQSKPPARFRQPSRDPFGLDGELRDFGFRLGDPPSNLIRVLHWSESTPSLLEVQY